MDDETKDTGEADQTASAGGAKPQATDADAPADRPAALPIGATPSALGQPSSSWIGSGPTRRRSGTFRNRSPRSP